MTEIPIGLCQCGCGGKTSIIQRNWKGGGNVKGQPYRFLSGHTRRTKHEGNKYRHKHVAGRPTTYEHVVIAERALGKRLPPGADVHHVDGNRRNNANANLVICQDRLYHMLLHVRARVLSAGGNPNTDLVCSACKAIKPIGEFRKGRKSICIPCDRAAGAAWRERNRAYLLEYGRVRRLKAGKRPRRKRINPDSLTISPDGVR